MNKFIICILFLSFWALYSVAEATPEEARILCIEKTVSRCLTQCQKTNVINCSTDCNEIAKNQCREAGE